MPHTSRNVTGRADWMDFHQNIGRQSQMPRRPLNALDYSFLERKSGRGSRAGAGISSSIAFAGRPRLAFLSVLSASITSFESA